MWELTLKLRRNGRIVTEIAPGLRSLAECRNKLRAIQRRAELEGTSIVEARAHPHRSAGWVPLEEVVRSRRTAAPTV